MRGLLRSDRTRNHHSQLGKARAAPHGCAVFAQQSATPAPLGTLPPTEARRSSSTAVSAACETQYFVAALSPCYFSVVHAPRSAFAASPVARLSRARPED